MKKLINTPEKFVDEALDGLLLAHPNLARVGASGRVVVHDARHPSRRVGIASGGGSGHLPLFTGYVGRGLLDACSIGNVFEGPNVESCREAIAHAASGQKVLCLYGNYGGDRMNFDMACELAESEGIETQTVLGTDDIASAAPDEAHKRRGVAGIVYAYKAAGAAADEGADLSEVAEAARTAVARTRSIGVALSPAQVPGSAQPTFSISDSEMELGMGIHGEPGIWRADLMPADAVADEMCDRLLAEAPQNAGSNVSVLVNSLGATPLEELFILYRRVAERLGSAGFQIKMPLVGHFATSMEMAGASISISFLDDTLERLYAMPASCPFWSVGK